MTHLARQDFESLGEAFDEFDSLIGTLKGFQFLLSTLADVREMPADHQTASGIAAILRQQIGNLEELYGFFQQTIQEAPNPVKSRAGLSIQQMIIAAIDSENVHRIAERLRLDDDTVYNVAMSLAFPDVPLKALERERASRAERRIANVENKLKDQIIAAEIAETLNLKESTVQRVIDVLTAGDKPYRDSLLQKPQETDSKAVSQ